MWVYYSKLSCIKLCHALRYDLESIFIGDYVIIFQINQTGNAYV